MKLNYKNIISILTVSLMLVSCGNSNKPAQQGPPPAVPVTVTEVTSANAVYYDQFPGTINALDQISLTSQVNGYITGIYFNDGQNVKKGQRLYSIDAQVYRANYEQAIADLQVQEANLVKAQKDADRYNELEKHDAIAKQQVDYANATLEATQKEVAAAKANVASIHSNVQFATIYAPFTGTIGISQVKKGTAVVAGQTILNTVSTNNPIAVDFTVDQKNKIAQAKKARSEKMQMMAQKRLEKMKTELNLSESQVAKIQAQRKNSMEQMKAIRESSTLSSNQKREQMMDLHKQGRESMKSILTADQYKKMQEMRNNRMNYWKNKKTVKQS